MRSFIAITCLAMMAGCSSVVLHQPFPDSPLTPEEQAQMSGTWLQENTVGHVEFTSNGIPWLAGIEWENDDFVVEKSRLYFARRNEVLYVCMPVEPDKTDEFLFGEIKVDAERAYVWGPNVDFFAEQVNQGLLKGRVEKAEHATTVTLEAPAAAILELISTNPAAIDYRNPLVFRKLK